MRRIRNYSVLLAVCAVVVAFWMGGAYAADKNIEVYTTGQYKSDMARMVEAYENLASQYLSLVQQNLSMMVRSDQQILNELTELEKKIDALTEKVNAMQPEKSPTQEQAAQPATFTPD